MIVYISAGNSDDKLLQAEWAELIGFIDQILAVNKTVARPGRPGFLPPVEPMVHVHGRWFAAPDTPWQSVCWCVEFDPTCEVVTADGHRTSLYDDLRLRLAIAAKRWRQNSIAWAPTPLTEFIQPPPTGRSDAT